MIEPVNTASASMINIASVLIGSIKTLLTLKLRTTIRSIKKQKVMIMDEKIPPVHPGAILLEDYLKPKGISMSRLALTMRVPANRIVDICNGKRSITADTALRLGAALGTSAEVWLGLQMDYDLDVASDKLRETIEKEVIPLVEPSPS
jgi:antitoxin HigA-1